VSNANVKAVICHLAQSLAQADKKDNLHFRHQAESLTASGIILGLHGPPIRPFGLLNERRDQAIRLRLSGVTQAQHLFRAV
jgi:hypothetical protein